LCLLLLLLVGACCAMKCRFSEPYWAYTDRLLISSHILPEWVVP
jgi:hypothetical protein